MFHRTNVNMILNHHYKNQYINFQHSYSDITDVIVVLCSINYLKKNLMGQNSGKFASILLQTTVERIISSSQLPNLNELRGRQHHRLLISDIND